MILELPIPPSVNHCWRFTSRGVFKKPEYIRWLKDAEIAAATQKVQRVPGPVAISIVIHPGDGWNIRRDPDNVLKCCLDFLQSAGGCGFIDGDDCRTMQRLFLAVGPVRKSACITVRIKEIKTPVIILTKAEAKQAARASVPRAKKAQKPKVEAGANITVEDEPRDSFFYSLEELREIAREAKSRGKAMATQISAQCDACR